MTQRDLAGYRVVAVHAHPDDESISTGGALASLAARGADVLVVTCTLGEEGEVIGETYQGLVADEADQLGGFRIGELERACRILGVRQVFLGGPGRYRDSGMVGAPSHANPRAFVNSGEAAVEDLAQLLAIERPHLVLTYGPDGGYGHPDHIRAHEITHAAARRVGGVPRILWAVRLRSDLEASLPADAPAGWSYPAPGELDAVEAADTFVELDDRAYSAKVEAMRSHATQVWIADGYAGQTNPHSVRAAGPVTAYALSNLKTQAVTRREYYQFGEGVELEPGADLLSGIEW
ncbi:N-acetyl-1-D-myo-inositol-2-amino-2-deoxy-alpha-D-glucopyranoside deacetylase [Corynebacterium liangguodongii]|uniref:N-acetyl-1-D-myo-inositol-2-amino-2-deoxy-alpha- D-glucopyranoside deacetylase n=1 Tax=Corynebacterium liangguodongii TaxID=2079535 RepID=UPI0015CFCA23|nr:N-acetyl-1-D-myo-inositol-2-amino-2-deoxy-alpha-D-glucopyranoside deacetylase [Corynebacterium liangguodongii]